MSTCLWLSRKRAGRERKVKKKTKIRARATLWNGTIELCAESLGAHVSKIGLSNEQKRTNRTVKLQSAFNAVCSNKIINKMVLARTSNGMERIRYSFRYMQNNVMR